MWSSDSDGESESCDIKLVPLTFISPPHQVSPPVLPHHSPGVSTSHQVSPPALVQHTPVGANLDQYCDFNLNRRPRSTVMSYPPRITNTDVQSAGTYHTLPVDGAVSKPAGDFKLLMENLAKKSEDVLKSKIFHSESCEAQNSSSPDYDVILNISFEEESPVADSAAFKVKDAQQISHITREIENLTKTVDDLQRSMSSIDLEEADAPVGSEVMSRSAGAVHYGINHQGNPRQMYSGCPQGQQVWIFLCNCFQAPH